MDRESMNLMHALQEASAASASQLIVLLKRMVQAGMEARAAEYEMKFQTIVAQQEALVAGMRKEIEARESTEALRESS
jgi:hypothetical protein